MVKRNYAQGANLPDILLVRKKKLTWRFSKNKSFFHHV